METIKVSKDFSTINVGKTKDRASASLKVAKRTIELEVPFGTDAEIDAHYGVGFAQAAKAIGVKLLWQQGIGAIISRAAVRKLLEYDSSLWEDAKEEAASAGIRVVHDEIKAGWQPALPAERKTQESPNAAKIAMAKTFMVMAKQAGLPESAMIASAVAGGLSESQAKALLAEI